MENAFKGKSTGGLHIPVAPFGFGIEVYMAIFSINV